MPSITQKDGKAYKALRQVLHHHRLTQLALCEPADLKTSALDSRMRAERPWDIAQIYRVMKYLGLPEEDVNIYFPSDPWEESRVEVKRC